MKGNATSCSPPRERRDRRSSAALIPALPSRATWLIASICGCSAFAAVPAPGERDIPLDLPRPTQRVNQGPPPSAPDLTPVDPGAPLPAKLRESPVTLRLRREPSSREPALPPTVFNPDPGAMLKPAAATTAHDDDLFATGRIELVSFEDPPIPKALALPRSPLERARIEPAPSSPPTGYGTAPLSPEAALPRHGTRENRFVPPRWSVPERYPASEAGHGVPPHAEPVLDRWRQTGFVPWRRHTGGLTEEVPYAEPQPQRWHFYRQSVLKGDLPYRGADRFLSLTATGETSLESRRVPLAAATPGGSREVDVHAFVGTYALQAEWFRGATVFRPVDWRVRVKPVLGVNHASVRDGIARPPSPLTGRLSLQEAFFEKHLRDLSPNYDFVSVRIGQQGFNSDFRGFVFNDTNLGIRLFGNRDANRTQYNAAVFDLREKDTWSELNTLDRRGQIVAIANVYRQDFGRPGYTAQASFHASFDEGGFARDDRGAIVRPAPVPGARPHRVTSCYFGWAGDGHLGRWNLSHAAYAVFGRDDFNPLAGQRTAILAHFAAVELSYDRDWIRWKASLLRASGDSDAGDRRATGFDAIVDNAHFTGGAFGYFARQGLQLGGTGLGLKPRFSLLPNLRTAKAGSQQNFVNPGLDLAGLGADLAVTPRLRAFAHVQHLRFVTTSPLAAVLDASVRSRALGDEASIGVQWRPWLTENMIVSAGGGVLWPGSGYEEIYRRAGPLHSAVVAMALTY